MEPSEPSPRRELQGPRPSPLKVSKESHKIKKPSEAPAAAAPPHAQPQHRPPVIIYTESPKVIHAAPSDFRSVVQRLTGASSSVDPSTASRSSSSYDNNDTGSGAMPLGAHMAAMEKTGQQPDSKNLSEGSADVIDHQQGIDSSGGMTVDQAGLFPGILSPVPSSLPSSHPTFSPSGDPNSPNSLSFLHDFSPAFSGNKSFMEDSFFASPSSSLPLPTSSAPSPSANWDLFDHFQDF